MASTAALLALALLAQDAPTPAATEAPVPAGAPADDFGLTAWCHGSLSRWMDLREQVMPEVRRIEGVITRPGSSLEEDMRAYDELEAQSRADLALFTRALRSMERASPRSVDAARDAAMTRGRAVWTGAETLTPARLAQEWMSWSLPARCQTAAVRLQESAELAMPAMRGTEAQPPGERVVEPIRPQEP